MPKHEHRRATDARGSIAERLMGAEKTLGDLTRRIPEWIANGVIAASGKVYQEVYDDIAKEHGRVFEVQEAAFMAVTEQLHERIATVEKHLGIVPPELASLRETVDAIGEYFGDVASEGRTPWADLTHEQRAIIVWHRVRCQRELAQRAERAVAAEGQP